MAISCRIVFSSSGRVHTSDQRLVLRQCTASNSSYRTFADDAIGSDVDVPLHGAIIVGRSGTNKADGHLIGGMWVITTERVLLVPSAIPGNDDLIECPSPQNTAVQGQILTRFMPSCNNVCHIFHERSRHAGSASPCRMSEHAPQGTLTNHRLSRCRQMLSK